MGTKRYSDDYLQHRYELYLSLYLVPGGMMDFIVGLFVGGSFVGFVWRCQRKIAAKMSAADRAISKHIG